MGAADEIFAPINEGLKAIRDVKKTNRELDIKEEQRKNEAEKIRAEIQTKSDKAKSQEDYANAAKNSPLAADPEGAYQAARNGASVTPFMKPKVTPDTLNKYNLQLVQQYGEVLSGLQDPNQDHDALLKQQQYIENLMGFTHGHIERKDAMKENFNKFKEMVPVKDRPLVQSMMSKAWNETMRPFYKEQGYTEEQLDNMEGDEKMMSDTVGNFAGLAKNPLEALLKANTPTLKGLDQKFDERMTSYDKLGSMTQAQLKSIIDNPKTYNAMDDEEKQALHEAAFARGLQEQVSRLVPGATIDENLFGRVKRRLALPPSDQLKMRIDLQQKQGPAKPGDASTMRNQIGSPPPQIQTPSDSGSQDVNNFVQ